MRAESGVSAKDRWPATRTLPPDVTTWQHRCVVGPGGRRSSRKRFAVLYDPPRWEWRARSAMPIRYMGTKRHIASRVRALVSDLRPKGQVLDLFSGMGSVAEELAGLRPVVTNDALEFTAPLARARFTAETRKWTATQVINSLRTPFREYAEGLSTPYRSRLREEQCALDSGPTALSAFIAESHHVAGSPVAARQATKAPRGGGCWSLCASDAVFLGGLLRCATDDPSRRPALRHRRVRGDRVRPRLGPRSMAGDGRHDCQCSRPYGAVSGTMARPPPYVGSANLTRRSCGQHAAAPEEPDVTYLDQGVAGPW